MQRLIRETVTTTVSTKVYEAGPDGGLEGLGETGPQAEAASVSPEAPPPVTAAGSQPVEAQVPQVGDDAGALGETEHLEASPAEAVDDAQDDQVLVVVDGRRCYCPPQAGRYGRHRGR